MPSDVRFALIRKMLEARGYRLDRVRGSHHVFVRAGSELVAVPVHHGKVKYTYVRQIEKLD